MGEYAGTLLFQYGNAESLAECLLRLLSLTFNERQSIGEYLRKRTIALHSIDRLAEKLIALLAEVGASR